MSTLEECRREYAEKIRVAAGLKCAALVEAFSRVRREAFLGPGPWKYVAAERLESAGAGPRMPVYVTTNDARDLYQDVLVALDAARGLNNGQPSALARWIEALALMPGDRVFHLGCGAGYYTAILAEVTGAKGSVVASEVDEELAGRARANLAGYPNVTVLAGDGAAIDRGNCDAMLINAGVTHPHALWLRRLSKGGRLIFPLTATSGQTIGEGVMVRVVREGDGFSASVISQVTIYSCTSVRDPQMERLLADALRAGRLLKMRSVRLEPHRKIESCLLHGCDVCISAREAMARG